MKGHLLVFICLLVISCAHGQTVLTGHVYDMGTGADLSDVEISWGDQQASTNLFGDFILQSGKSETAAYRFLQNAVFWTATQTIDISIVSLNGSVIVDESVNGDHYLIPRLKTGMYVLSLKKEGHQQHFKIMSDGSNTIKVDTRGIFHTNQQIIADTLHLSKKGYYPRKFPFSSKGQPLSIPMLSGSYENLDYLDELIAPLAYDLLSSTPSRTNLGDVREVKIIYDTKQDRLYYMNSSKYELHFTFAAAVLGYDKGLYLFNLTQYQETPSRYLHMASVNYYKGIDQYVLQFVTAVDMSCEQIKTLYQKILSTSFLDENTLRFYATKDEWKSCSSIPQISSEVLYRGQVYQGLNLEENYGYLRKVSAEDLSKTFVGRRDIVLTDGVPNDLPVIAGIITSDFQTPLSHINVLSNSRGAPNMAVRGAWDSTSFASMEGKLVYLKVKSEAYELREASLPEASAFWSAHEPKDTIRLKIDVNFNHLIDLENANYTFVNKIGGKAANFSEMLHVTNVHIPTPEGSFAIPFHHYDAHMKAYGLYQFVGKMMANPQFQTDVQFRASQLAQLRDSITQSPLDPQLIEAVKSKINNFADFKNYRFRSSTNAEDLEDFSGAGLYESYSAKKNHDTKTIENAIRKVWASLWNFRAFEERSYFKIDHATCAMGILVHRSFPDEDANGVLITKNLYNTNPAFTINVQYKEYSIVFPEPGIIHDQMLLFTWSVNPAEQFMLEYLNFSNVPELKGKTVMTDEEVFELGRYAEAIKRRFYYELPHNCDCVYKDFGVDIEFKVDSDISPRKIYIKQARLYK